MGSVVASGRLKTRIFVIAGITALLSTGSALATDYHSPRTAALGGSGRAGPLLNDAIYLNPSYASFMPTNSVGASYQWFNGDVMNLPQGPIEQHSRLYNISIQDGRNPTFQAGGGYSVLGDGAMLNLGAAKSFVQRWGAGLGLKFFFPNNPDVASVREGIVSSTLIAGGWIQLAAIMDNAFQTQPAQARKMYREFALAAKVNISGIAIIYLDPHYTPDLPLGPAGEDRRYGHELGLELTIMNDLFLRGGVFKNAYIPFQGDRAGGFGLGAGWVTPRMSLDYGMTRVVHPTPPLTAATAHSIGMTLYF